ncbi:MAG: hypothetical protein R3E65_06365 [Steroidobacteraceae bacterium]
MRRALERVAAARYPCVLATDSMATAISALTAWPSLPMQLAVILDEDFIHGESAALADWLALERQPWHVVWRGLRRPTDARTPTSGLDCLTKPVPLGQVFDAVDEEATAAAAEPSSGPRDDLAGARVLVVEDNVVNHEIVRAMLDHLG